MQDKKWQGKKRPGKKSSGKKEPDRTKPARIGPDRIERLYTIMFLNPPVRITIYAIIKVT
jgi:hypothetical protein